MMIQDPATAGASLGRLVETWQELDEDHYLDGPVTPRVAVIDLDPETGRNVPGAKFRPPRGSRVLGAYQVDVNDIYSPEFIAVSTWATVLRTMYMYEEPDALGRRLRWGFDAPQLLVVPRAGMLDNAFYERDSHSLQFFSFKPGDKIVHTSLSRDIVAHETGHAILDGISPDLYDALDPQASALHEAIADLTALSLAFRSRNLRDAVLRQTNGSIADSSPFSSIGEEFGGGVDAVGNLGFLRNLHNDRTVPAEPANQVEEHGLSEVLTGALYSFMRRLHEKKRAEVAARTGRSEFSASGQALFEAAEHFKRVVFRGLDYLPPGEASFEDYARAIIAADQASHPTDDLRPWFKDMLADRGIVIDARSLDVVTNESHPAVAALDLNAVVESDWLAYSFANENRDLLHIPADVTFEVLPRLVVNKAYYPTREPIYVRELLFKVSWTIVEENPADIPGPPRRRVKTGTTLAIDWERRLIRGVLHPGNLDLRRPYRDARLRDLVRRGLIRFARPDQPAEERASAIGPEGLIVDDVLRVRDTAKLLHLAREYDDG